MDTEFTSPAETLPPSALQIASGQYAARRNIVFQRVKLSPLMRIMLWSLRIYVVVMLAVVVIQLSRLIRP